MRKITHKDAWSLTEAGRQQVFNWLQRHGVSEHDVCEVRVSRFRGIAYVTYYLYRLREDGGFERYLDPLNKKEAAKATKKIYLTDGALP